MNRLLLTRAGFTLMLFGASLLPYVALAQHEHHTTQKPTDPHAGHKPAASSTAPSQTGHGPKPGMKQGMRTGIPPARRKSAARPKSAPSHVGHANMSGMKMDKAPATDPHVGHKSAPSSPAAPSHDHGKMPGMKMDGRATADAHAGHAIQMKTQTGAQLSVGNEPAPAVSLATAADTFFTATVMDRARGVLRDEHGGSLIFKLMAEQAEFQSGPHGAGYEWRGEAWYGGDINRFVAKSEGTGTGADGVERAELQALYSRAIGRYTDLQLGIRQDFDPLIRTYATIGVEALIPYWFKVDGALFISDRGTGFARLEGMYDFMLTQQLVLQPRAELNVAFQDERSARVGSGISDAELGMRLRYEISRDFAPYIGVSYERNFGRTADFVRAGGKDIEATKFVMGLRAWL